jgi:hypothetical protein
MRLSVGWSLSVLASAGNHTLGMAIRVPVRAQGIQHGIFAMSLWKRGKITSCIFY